MRLDLAFLLFFLLEGLMRMGAGGAQKHKSEKAQRKGANTRDANYWRTELGYKVTGQTFKSNYILGSSLKLASWFAPALSLLEVRCNAEWV